MPIYVTRWFILSLKGQNGFPGFGLFLKKCEGETKKDQHLYQKEISTPHITALMLKAIPLSSS